MHRNSARFFGAAAAVVFGLAMAPAAAAQNAPAAAATTPAPPRAGPPPTAVLPAGPFDYQTSAGKIHVEVVARRLDHPWALAQLPDGTMLVTERAGRLRIVRDGKLEAVAIDGKPPNNPSVSGALYDNTLDHGYA
jgi:glucose/arabinose dehydrogenase